MITAQDNKGTKVQDIRGDCSLEASCQPLVSRQTHGPPTNAPAIKHLTPYSHPKRPVLGLSLPCTLPSLRPPVASCNWEPQPLITPPRGTSTLTRSHQHDLHASMLALPGDADAGSAWARRIHTELFQPRLDSHSSTARPATPRMLSVGSRAFKHPIIVI